MIDEMMQRNLDARKDLYRMDFYITLHLAKARTQTRKTSYTEYKLLCHMVAWVRKDGKDFQCLLTCVVVITMTSFSSFDPSTP